MLSHMETDVAAGVVSSIQGNIFRFTQKNGTTPEIEEDIKTILAFKRRALFDFKNMEYKEIKLFSKKWFGKYPNNGI